jgi:hypothetical protein
MPNLSSPFGFEQLINKVLRVTKRVTERKFLKFMGM